MNFLRTLSDTYPEFGHKPRFMPILAATVLIGLIGVYLKYKVVPLLGKNLPPGSYGLPFIGESISFLAAQKQNKVDLWVQERIDKYGPVFKTSILGSKMVVATGQSGNRFMFSGTNPSVTTNQPASQAGIFGKHSLFEVSGARHKLIRCAITGFIRPESIQRFVGQMDLVVRQQLAKALDGKDSVEIVPLMKKVTFNVACSIFFKLADGKEKGDLLEDFTIAGKGLWSLPLNLPGTTFHKALKARARICKVLSNLIALRKKEMEHESYEEDIISSFLNLRDENGEPLSEVATLDNFLSLVFATHDTTAILLSLFVRHLARDPKVRHEVLQEQKEVLKAMKGREGEVRWSEVQMMKYTWRVAQELLRLTPPMFGNFRSIIGDTTFENFDIPKGWKGYWVASTHIDEKIFEEPEKFDPSRFDIAKKSIPPYSYVPFGAGPRICPGSDFARTEVLLIMHHLVTKYEWTQMIPDEPITREPLPYPVMGLPVKIFPRNIC